MRIHLTGTGIQELQWDDLEEDEEDDDHSVAQLLASTYDRFLKTRRGKEIQQSWVRTIGKTKWLGRMMKAFPTVHLT